MADEQFYKDDPLDDEREPGGAEKLPEFSYELDAENLVTEFLDKEQGEEALREMSQRLKDDFDDAFNGSADYRERRARDWKIFSCDLPPKDWPFEHAANMHDPLMIEAISRLVSRYKAELFGDRTSVFNVIPVGPDDKERAKILSKHGNWQIREDIPDFFVQQSKGILEWFLSGDVTFHSHYDTFRKQNRHEALSCDEFVTPYTYTSTMPDYSDCPYYARIHHLYAHEILAMEDLWEGVDAVIKRRSPSWEDEPEQLLGEAAAQTDGVEIPDDRGPYKIIQYEGWQMLPKQDRPHWIQAYFDHDTGNIMQMSVHEEPTWKERARYNEQLKQREGYYEQEGMFETASDEAAAAREMALSPDPMQAQQAQEILMRPELPPPSMPSWMTEDDDMPPEMEMMPIHMFTHGQFIVPLAGGLGLGPGRIQADLNRASNTALSQFTDSATLNNCQVLVTSGLVEFERPFTYSPGAINKVSGVTGGELRNHIMPLESKPASPQLMELVRFASQKSQSSMQSPDVLSGAAGKSGETYRGLATRVEQATKSLSVSAQDYAYGVLRNVLVNNGRMNAIHLPEDEIKYVLDHKTGELDELRYGKGLYQRGYQVSISSNLKFSSEAAEKSEAETLVQMGQNDDMLKQNVPFRLEALKRYLEANGLHDMVSLLQPPPMGPPPPGTTGSASQPKGPSGATGAAPEG